MKNHATKALCLWLLMGCLNRAPAILFLQSNDPQFHASSPGDNSGWQYEGKFRYFLGVPIAPHFFITAKHFGGNVGDTFDFHGDIYQTIAFHADPSSDLMIWEVNHAKPFPIYAPLSNGTADIGATATIFGRGTQRGSEIIVNDQAKGWNWGPGDDVKRWGRNVVTDQFTTADNQKFLRCHFDNPGIDGECHLSVGDSGGGMFVLENGLWRLAGVNCTVDGPFRTSPTGPNLSAALYDMGGLYQLNDATPPEWTLTPDPTQNIPSALYASRTSTSRTWITAIAADSASLAPESFNAWLHLYFSPTQIATPASTAPLADFDHDGICNLLEFALNLDPTFNERATMIPNTGLRGLPLIHLEHIDGADCLTIEFVRRTSTSNPGINYIPESSADLLDWQTMPSATITEINPRWERVKIVDAPEPSDPPRRFVRLRVTQ